MGAYFMDLPRITATLGAVGSMLLIIAGANLAGMLLALIPQIALALILLLVTGVFVRALLRLELAHPGYDPEHVVTLDVQLPQRPITTNDEAKREGAVLRDLQARIVERLGSLAGVTSAAVTAYSFDGVPLAASGTSVISRADYDANRQHRGVTAGYVSAGYFETLGIPLRRGRLFDSSDRTEAAHTVVVSERLAGELWPGADPVGQQMAQHSADSIYPIRWVTVIGVVASVTRPLDEYPRPVFYVPIESTPLMGTTFLLRGAGNPKELAAAAKQPIAAVDRSVIVARAGPLAETVSDVRYPRRFSAALLGASGMAERRDVIRLILSDGAGVLAAGIVIGFALAFAAIRYASHAIVPLPGIDALTFMTVPSLKPKA